VAKVTSLRKKIETAAIILVCGGLGVGGVTVGYDITSDLSAHKKPTLNYVLSLESRINEKYNAKDLIENQELRASIKKSYEAYKYALSDPKIKAEYDAYKKRESAIKKIEDSSMVLIVGPGLLFAFYDIFRRKKKPESK
jgi:hypothetical protein